jgi:hypothetical protein
VPGPSSRFAIYPVSAAEIMELAAYDRPKWGANRLPDLAALIAARPHQSFVAVDRTTKAFAGFALASADRIGPLMADAPEATAWLLFAIEQAGAPPRMLLLESNPSTRDVMRAAGYEPTGQTSLETLPEDLRVDVVYGV